jgi:hypothetical protein
MVKSFEDFALHINNNCVGFFQALFVNEHFPVPDEATTMATRKVRTDPDLIQCYTRKKESLPIHW